jgi:hypothetical protein
MVKTGGRRWELDMDNFHKTSKRECISDRKEVK